jgi:hypothetical protein
MTDTWKAIEDAMSKVNECLKALEDCEIEEEKLHRDIAAAFDKCIKGLDPSKE